ncbi:MAG: dihydrofolate reductase family protein [Gemmatimonadota bacterium]|nr:dihydrofolate reductase family protein [Gemmatimonadota bacterium]
MRRVRLSVAMSLDGYIAGPDGEYDWIPEDPGIDMAELFKDFDTILMGRRSYEAVRKQEAGIAMFGMPVVVFSSTLKAEDHPGVTVSRSPEATVRELRAKPGKDLWLFGGGELLRSFLEAGLVDGMDIAVMPILLGRGLPLLPPTGTRVALTLVSHRAYQASGTVLLTYDVRKDGASEGVR